MKSSLKENSFKEKKSFVLRDKKKSFKWYVNSKTQPW